MANSAESSRRWGKVLEILWHYSDEDHPLTRESICRRLEDDYLITVKRDAITRDIKKINEMNFEVTKKRIGNKTVYHLADRLFSVAEISVLIDCVIASHSLSDSESKVLIEKLLRLRSYHEAAKVKRCVYSSGRVKYCNNEVVRNVELLNQAILQKKKVRFTYLQWNTKKELKDRYEGEPVIADPSFLVIDDEKYYAVAWWEKRDDIRTFRVDKIRNMEITDEPCIANEKMNNLNPAEYAEQHFGMFGGKREQVYIEGDSEHVGILIDRLGTGISIRDISDKVFKAVTTVHVSNEFYGWIDGLDGILQIAGPKKIVSDYKAHVQRLADRVLRNS